MPERGYRLREPAAVCAGGVSVHRADRRDRPGRLVRLTRIDGQERVARCAAQIPDWQQVRHPALLPVELVAHDRDQLVLQSPHPAARPLDLVHEVSGTPFDAVTVATFGQRIAAGLTALHEQGMAHGGIGLHTLLLAPDHTVVLDGPWHRACRRDGVEGGEEPAPRLDVRDLAAALLSLLPTDDEAPRTSAATGSDRTTTLHALLDAQRRDPGDASALHDALGVWATDDLALRAVRQHHTPAGQEQPSVRAERSAPEPRRRTRRSRPKALVGMLAIITATTAAIAMTLLRSPADGIVVHPLDHAVAPSPPMGSEEASTAARAEDTDRATGGPVQAGPQGPPPARPERADTATIRPVCPGATPPVGPGRLVLADLHAAGCRGPVRIDGGRLLATRIDGSVTEVELDLEPEDQVRVAALEGSDRDEVVVYRPRTGEIFRFDGLAGPGETITADGQASGWIGGVVVVITAADGVQHLEIRDGEPA